MLRWIVAGAAFIALESAASACSCVFTQDSVELRRFAAETAKEVIAVVEAEALTSFEGTQRGEHMRVVRILAGDAPGEFRIPRGPMPSSASCDVLYQVGKRTILIVYPAASTAGSLPVHPTADLCTQHLLEQPAFRDALIQALNWRGERG